MQKFWGNCMTAPRSLAEVCESIARSNPTGSDLTFGPWSVEDAPALVAAWNDAEIAKWNPVPQHPTLDLAENWIRSTSTQSEASIGLDVVATADNATADRAVVGEVGLQVDPVQAIGEVGFWVAAEHRGAGAGRMLLSFAEHLCAELELVGLVALVNPANGAAIALLQSQGWPEVPTKSARRGFAYRIPTPREPGT